MLYVRKILFVFLVISLFPDMTAQQQDLGYYLDQGLQNSPLLKYYENRLRSGHIDSLRLRAGLGVQVSATSVNSYAPVYRGWGYDEVKTDIFQVGAMVGISRQITGGNHLLNKYQALNLQNQSVFLEGSLSEKDLKKEIIAQYILAYGDQKQYLVNAEILEVMKQEEQVVKRLAEQGVLKQTEYLSLLVNLRQQDLITSQSANQTRTDIETLNYICGLYDTARVKLAEPALVLSVPAEVNRTPFYQQFVTDSLRLVNADRQINFDYRPRLSVYADGGYLSSLAYTPWKNFGLSAGLTLTVPIYDGRQRKMQHDQVAISQETRAGYQHFFTGRYRQQIAMLTRQLMSNDLLGRQSRDQLNYAQTLVDANRLLLNSGDIAVTDFLLSVSNYLTIKIILTENTRTRFNIINELNYWYEK